MTRSLKMTGSSLSAAALPALCVVAAIAVAQDEETGADTGVEKAPPAGTRVEAEAEDAPLTDSDQVGAENNPLAIEMNDALTDAVQRGLIYLESQQNSDGSFGRGQYGRHVGITALCGLAFMADGNLPGRGPYGEQVEAALRFVLDHATDSGLLAAETSHGPMYGHGFATLFLGEIYGMNPQDQAGARGAGQGGRAHRGDAE